MKSTLTALVSAAALCMAAPALAQDGSSGSGSDDGPVTLGILLGFTGPLESLSPTIAEGAELAISEVNESGNFLGGRTVDSVRADDTCIDSGAATSAAERLITSDQVVGIMGAMCSGVTGAVLQNVAVPNGVVMISPSATSPALSTVEDNGLFFRTAPSDARQSEIITQILTDRGVESAALTYTNNDYGKGLSDTIAQAFEDAGGTITINAAHEDGKGDYSAEVASLAAAGGDILIVAGYLDQGGRGIIQASLDSGAFDTFFLPDGMVGPALPEAIGSPLDGSYGVLPGSESEGSEIFANLFAESGGEVGVYAPEAYDATALMLLAMQKTGSTDPDTYKTAILEIANEPGEPILPGELGKALQILADGGDVDYIGATAVEMVDVGESEGAFREIEIRDGAIETVQYR